MLGNFLVITLTHKSQKLGDLGRFILGEENLSTTLSSLKKRFDFEGLLYTATCNRMLFFIETSTNGQKVAVPEFFNYLYPELPQEEIAQAVSRVELYEGEASTKHLFEVASSIDSLVVGEREIFRQIRESYERCLALGLISDSIRVAYQQMVSVAKNVYANTKIGEKSVSVVSLAMNKLSKMKLHKEAKIVMIGAGQTNVLVSKFLKKYGFNNVTVYNRTFEKAKQIADQFSNGAALPLAELNELKTFDALFITTSAKDHLLAEKHFQQLQPSESKRVIIDLSIPSNVEKSLCEQYDIDVIDIDSLKNLAKENLSFRMGEVKKVHDIIMEGCIEFRQIYKRRLLERAFQEIPHEIKAVRVKATEQVFRQELSQLDEDTQLLFHKMMDYMEKKCIGIPMKAVKDVAI